MGQGQNVFSIILLWNNERLIPEESFVSIYTFKNTLKDINSKHIFIPCT